MKVGTVFPLLIIRSADDLPRAVWPTIVSKLIFPGGQLLGDIAGLRRLGPAAVWPAQTAKLVEGSRYGYDHTARYDPCGIYIYMCVPYF